MAGQQLFWGCQEVRATATNCGLEHAVRLCVIHRKSHRSMGRKKALLTRGCGTGVDNEKKCFFIRSLDPDGAQLDGTYWQVSKRIRH